MVQAIQEGKAEEAGEPQPGPVLSPAEPPSCDARPSGARGSLPSHVQHPGAWAQLPSYAFPRQCNLLAPSLFRPQTCSQLIILLLITEKNRSNQERNSFSHHQLHLSTSVSTRNSALKADAPRGPGPWVPQLVLAQGLLPCDPHSSITRLALPSGSFPSAYKGTPLL